MLKLLIKIICLFFFFLGLMFNFSPKSYSSYYGIHISIIIVIYIFQNIVFSASTYSSSVWYFKYIFKWLFRYTCNIKKKWQSNKTLSNISLKHYKNCLIITDKFNWNFSHRLLNSMVIFFYMYFNLSILINPLSQTIQIETFITYF